MLNHPKDRHVTAAAVACGADTIVTDNLKDFPREALAPFNLEARSADEFLMHLFSLAPDGMITLITGQAKDYAFLTMTPLELLDRLAKAVPQFAEGVRLRLA